MKIFIDATKCTICEECAEKCNTGALAFDFENKVVIKNGLCTGCEVCVDVCPEQAIIIYF